jgi:hypothetical protein
MIDYLDEDVAYLLGLIVARGTVTKKGGVNQMVIEIPVGGLEAIGISKRITQSDRIKISLNDTIKRIRELIDAEVRIDDESRYIRLIIESLRNTIFWRDINFLLKNKQAYYEFEVPSQIYEATTSIKKEFIRGFADVAGSARASNRDRVGRHRIYLDVLNQNWKLPVQLCYLLQDHLDVPVDSIIWGHPNLRDPNLKSYKEGHKGAWAREHQIKIYAEHFNKIGFYMSHKQEILEELADYNRKKYKEPESFCTPPKKKERKKTKHPEEKNKKLPDCLRKKHFNSYWEICGNLGCPRYEAYKKANKKFPGM